MPVYPESDDATRTVRRWLDQCKYHDECNREPDGISLPTRVVDVGGFDGFELRLHETTGTAHMPYVALSHCWGSLKSCRLTSYNLQHYTKQILPSELPQTFKDAVRVTRLFGFRYLWIDSLCIIQDDRMDWEVESAKMSSIYNHAYLVVAASCAANAEAGFLHPRPITGLKCGSLLHDGRQHDTYLCDDVIHTL